MPSVPELAERNAPHLKTDAFLRGFGKLILSTFYRQIEVVGMELMPTTGPVIVVANHVNSIVDGALLTAYLSRMPRLLAASTVWENKPIAPLLNAAGVIPIYRQQDAGGTVNNKEAFSKAYDLLESGGVLSLFPEGITHNEPFVSPVKTGAARIALQAEDLRGPLGIRIVPVGLIFDNKSKFRSRVLLQMGPPIDLSSIIEKYTQGDDKTRRTVVNELTENVMTAISELTHNYENWDEARLISRAAAIWSRPILDLPSKEILSERFKKQQLFLQGYRWMTKNHPRRTTAVKNVLIEYDEYLSSFRLRDEQVGAEYPAPLVINFIGRAIFTLLIRTNISLLGTILNLLPYFVTKLIGGSYGLDQRATWSIFPSLMVFPVFWLAESIGIAIISSQWWGMSSGAAIGSAAFILAPISGRIALTFHDKLHQLFCEGRAWVLLRAKKRLTGHLVEKRQEVLEQIQKLVEVYQSVSEPKSS
ncbi:MAG: lysophospholipid acyltransferase family protein [Paracoccaceae bacterium]